MPTIDSGGAGACRSRGRREAIPKPVSLTSPVVRLTRIFAGLMSLWTRPRRWTCVRAAATAMARRRKLVHLHGHAEQSVQRLAACVLEHQHHPAAFADELERSHRPRPVQLVLQAVFARKAIEGGRRRMLCDGHHDQDGDPITVGVALSPAEDAFAVLPQHLEATYLHQRRTKRMSSSAGSSIRSRATIKLRTSYTTVVCLRGWPEKV